jgi:hypothetical protein
MDEVDELKYLQLCLRVLQNNEMIQCIYITLMKVMHMGIRLDVLIAIPSSTCIVIALVESSCVST